MGFLTVCVCLSTEMLGHLYKGRMVTCCGLGNCAHVVALSMSSGSEI